MERKIRVGIDVGGTNTKAVALDNADYSIVGVGIVPTTHESELGVSEGVVESFRKCLTENDIDPKEVVFIAHSTTQATNALLEGDVAKVGIVNISAGALVGFLSKMQAKIKDIVLDASGKRKITTAYRYLPLDGFTKDKARQAVKELIENEKCDVIAASKTFGVDDMTEELVVREVCEEMGIEMCCASDISKLYGLSRRTRTAVINGSILPKMISTADSTEDAVREAGIEAPLMIMRGDGGVMDIEEMRKRPVLTMLSGPAASTVGALMYLKVSNGIFFEVGGTSTDIGVIKNGRPMIDYAVVGGHSTMVNSMDVHVSGVAGGSMVRANSRKVEHVGPRSAHIANLPYVAFEKPENIVDPKVVYVQPLADDPNDYVAIECANGQRYAITVTCAANALGIVVEGDYSYGYPESCRRAIEALGKTMGKSMEECATAILDNAADTCIDVIETLCDKYKVERSQVTIVGGGGGAKALLPFTADKIGMPYKIADQAEVISSIGVGLAMVRDTVERVIPSPTQEDIQKLRQEAKDAVIASGATADSVEIQIEIDSQSSKVRAIATGSTEVATQDLSQNVNEEEARAIAAESMNVDPSAVVTQAKNEFFCAFTTPKGGKNELRLVDRKGLIKRQRADAVAVVTSTGGARTAADHLWEENAVFKSDIKLNPDIYMCIGGQVIDYEGLMDAQQLNMLMDTELSMRMSNENVILIAAKNDL